MVSSLAPLLFELCRTDRQADSSLADGVTQLSPGVTVGLHVHHLEGAVSHSQKDDCLTERQCLHLIFIFFHDSVLYSHTCLPACWLVVEKASEGRDEADIWVSIMTHL